ncbi:MAG: HAMP domain-containing histidine kinase, partial [Candidatus Tectomicrobia bacterium]|nr:HAMP domain-containing histidine kinase [Candidatus Tectomicrobia bacterium]
AMMRGETGVSTFYSPPMQADMIAGHTAVPKVGWGVMVPQPMQELLDRTRDVKGAALKISLLGMMIAGLISWWLSKSLARPIEAVRHAAHAIASGQLDTQVPALTKRAPVELQDLAHSFNQMVNHLSQTHQEWLKALRAAEQASRAKSEFLANLSHELRTPLHGILSFAEFGIETVDTDSNEELETYFQRIHQSGATLLTLLNALLDLAKLEAGKMAFRFEPVDLGQLFDSAIDEVRTLVVQRHLTIRHDPFDTPIETVVDSEKTMQVIRNLLNNAVKFSPEGGSITIDMHQDSQSVIITISDQGPGIPDAELESIFDKFIQSSRTNTGAGGTGLGLAICREIVMAHQGRIWAENAAGGGARLILELPLQGRNKAALEPVSIRTEHAVVNG